jgi:iron complex outermembrane recepter protein
MKRIIMLSCFIITTIASFSQQTEVDRDSFYLLTPIEVRAIRAGENSPFTKTNISKKEIGKMNLGQDIPFLLNQTPSVVINADAGNGVGYTGIRIRGTDATRINVTLNGIPYNDAESQGTFFVNLPDFSSSVNSIQVQRGAGTSSNGAGAFGASINMSTNEVNKEAFAEINNTFGSFNTWKNTIKVGSGLLNDHFTVDARLSNITSDGYIDRATSDLKSAYLSAAWLNSKSTLRLNIFTGKEKTYQAWYGISEADIKGGNRTINYAGMEKPGMPYDNETDNYIQTHYQFFYTQQINNDLSFNTALFLTRGKGYYEQYKAKKEYAGFGLPNPVIGNTTITESDFIRQLWLDNYFYGNIFSLQYKKKNTQLVLGGAYTKYDGDHYGKLIWSSNGGLPEPDYTWYKHDAVKKDFNFYTKWQQKFSDHWNLFADLQYRHIGYDINGFRDNPALVINNNYNFFNPKAGISYSCNGWSGYFSYGVAAKEPNRDDFEAGASQLPKPEKLHDFELGIERKISNYNWSATLYYMNYKNQLILTGQINDVGAYTRTNISESYRAGIELQGGIKFNSWMNASANLAFSSNKVKNFTEYFDDYDNGGQKNNTYRSTDIAFSPAIVAGATINFFPFKNAELSLLSKYVSWQYLDNTENDSRSLNPFYVQDIRAIYTIKKNPITIGWLNEINIFGQVNNILGRKYEPNGYTYSYFVGGETVTENYYFPMAGRNFVIGLNVRL